MNNVDIGRYGKRLVQYIWDPEPMPCEGDKAAAVWCLGRCYKVEYAAYGTEDSPTTSASNAAGSESPVMVPEEPLVTASDADSSFEDVKKTGVSAELTRDGRLGWPKAFLDDFESRIWLTYRSGFPEIAKSHDPKAASAMSLSVRLKSQLIAQNGFTSDTGWGCMIRSGQCLLANALALLRLGRDWVCNADDLPEQDVLRLFADSPDAPFSIHRFVEHGAAACGTFPGQWFGPSATAKCIEALSNGRDTTGLRVYVTGDGPDVFQDGVFQTAKDDLGHFRPTLLLIGTRLGIDRVTPAYWPALKACLQIRQAVGIAGGRPSASHYFVGTQDSHFYYLDPHHTRPALPFRENADYTREEVDSCHTRRLRRLSVEDMDPSMLIAFLIRDEDDWWAWRQSIDAMPGKAVVHVSDVESPKHGMGGERDGAVDEVQILDDEEDEEDEGDAEARLG